MGNQVSRIQSLDGVQILTVRPCLKKPAELTLLEMHQISYYSYWLSVSNWYHAPAEKDCGDEVVTKNECIEAFTAAMTICDPNSGETSFAPTIRQLYPTWTNPSHTKDSRSKSVRKTANACWKSRPIIASTRFLHGFLPPSNLELVYLNSRHM